MFLLIGVTYALLDLIEYKKFNLKNTIIMETGGMKGKRKEIAREIAYQEGPRAARRARAIITNPIHIAVALKYNPKEEPAPIILTMGAGAMANAIIKIGVENNIPIMRNVELARALHARGTISDYIPEDLYPIVAEVIKWIESLEAKSEVNKELF